MSDLTQSAMIAAPPKPNLWARLMAQIAQVDAAHTNRARFSTAMDAVSRDCGRPVEDLLGAPGYDPALPFFMQRGFDRAE